MAVTEVKTQVVVLGSGPGGYTAAFRAADLGKEVTLIERYDSLGGVCLNVGCIPSKALLHTAKVLDDAKGFASHGITFAEPAIDITKLAAWKNSVVTRLTGGLKALAKQRKVNVVTGVGEFVSSNKIKVVKGSDEIHVEFDYAIIAAGSRPVKLPFMPNDPRIVDSTGALDLKEIPKEMLVVGGGIIGLEMATVYRALGANITVVELAEFILPGVDKDIANPLFKKMKKECKAFLLGTKVVAVEAKPEGIFVKFEGAEAPAEPVCFDKVLVAVGRVPNGKLIGADKAGVNVDERGFITVDGQQRTNVQNIFAIGDICGNPMLAHKAIPEGRVAAEVIAGMKHYFDPKCIPNVAYTDPEVAWVGLTETEAKQKGIAVEKGVFPWAASGRSLANGRDEGVTKVLFDPATHRVLGAGIVGTSAGDLISEMALAIEMGCEAEDIALTIHPHPTLSETIAQATEAFEGTITDLYMPKKK